MSFKKTYSNSVVSGFTIVELIIAVTIITLLSSWLIVKMNPEESKQKARDSRRLTDLVTLQRAISEYSQDMGSFPDSINTLRLSNVAPVGSVDVYKNTGGWIAQDLSSYLITYPTDPVNDENFYYSYTHDATSYEINAKLEFFSEYAQNDGGNDSTIYEVGTNLLLIEP